MAEGWLLALHTATPVLGLALVALGSEPSRSQGWRLEREMAGQLHPLLRAFLAPQDWSDLVGVGVVVGPGSFTGCRLGVTVARTLGQSLRIPIYGVSSLAALAHSHFSQDPERVQDPEIKVAVQMDAQRGEWYCGLYRWDPSQKAVVAILPERLWTVTDWEATLQRQAIATLLNVDLHLDPLPVLAVGEMAAVQYAAGLRPSWETVSPLYGRTPPIHSGS